MNFLQVQNGRFEKNWASSFLVGFFCAFRFFCCFRKNFKVVEVLFFYSRFFKFFWNIVTTVMGSFLVAPLAFAARHSNFWNFFSRFSTFDVFLRCVVFFENIFKLFQTRCFFSFFSITKMQVFLLYKRQRVTKVTQAVASWSGAVDIYRGDRGAVAVVKQIFFHFLEILFFSFSIFLGFLRVFVQRNLVDINFILFHYKCFFRAEI